MGRRPIEFGSSSGRVGPLIEQEHLGEVVAQPGPSLIVGARDGPGAPAATAAASVNSATVGFSPSPTT